MDHLRGPAGSVRLLITDLAGTAVDYGSCAPAGVFVQLFGLHGVEISLEQARGPMGIEKKDHIRALVGVPEIAGKWERVHGTGCTEADIDRMYREFIPLQVEALPRYSGLIPGVLEATGELRKRGVRIAANTGYNREMTEIVLREAQRQGFVPDAAACATDVPKGRPAPWMIFALMQRLDVFPPAAVVKIGDTVPDIEEGLNAGAWTVGVARTGNLIGLTEAEIAALPATRLESLLQAARGRLRRAGAHYVIDSIADCVPIVDEINARLHARVS
jgi:phosphonoacetaldehyde hydrolase